MPIIWSRWTGSTPHEYSQHPLRSLIRCAVRHFDAGGESASSLGGTQVLAGLLYCGAGVGVAVVRRFVRPMLSPPGIVEVALTRGDLPWLAGAVISGGVVGPVLLMVGLTRAGAATASLLLTLEGVATEA